MNKLTALDRAYAMAGPVVFAATPDTYDRPTPCRAWDVRTLLNHLIRVIDQFPVVLAGDKADWVGAAFTDDPAQAFRSAVAANLAAWRKPGAVETPGRLPGTYWVDINLTDTVMHTWDLAQAIGHELVVDEELVDFVLETCTDAAFLRDRGRAFGPAVAVRADAATIDRLAGLLGRQPVWRSVAHAHDLGVNAE
jgi:uncharacterized protein (TIGR03086 family)